MACTTDMLANRKAHLEDPMTNVADELLVKAFKVRSSADAFEDYARAEIDRQRETDATFDAALYEKAVQLVLTRLQGRGQGVGS
jgi:hypothetical protein